MTDVMDQPASAKEITARLPLPPLPERVVEPLRIVAARARILAWLRALLQLCALVAVIWLALVLVLGWRVQVPLWIGIPLIVAGWAAVIYGAYRIFRRLYRRRRGLAAAARLSSVSSHAARPS